MAKLGRERYFYYRHDRIFHVHRQTWRDVVNGSGKTRVSLIILYIYIEIFLYNYLFIRCRVVDLWFQNICA